MGASGIVVDQKGVTAYRSISQAVADAGPDAMITVRPGDYWETVVLDRPVTLILADSPGAEARITGTTGPALRITADATVRGLTLRGPFDSAAAVVIEAGAATLERCSVFRGQVEVSGPAAPILVGCRIRASSGVAIRVTGSANAELRDCELSDLDGDGLRIEDWARVRATGLGITSATGSGVRMLGAASGEFDGATITEIDGYGIEVAEVCRLRFTGTIRDTGRGGLVIGGQSYAELTDAMIEGTAGTSVAARGLAVVVAHGTRLIDTGGNALFATDRAVAEMTGCELRNTRFSAVHLAGNARLVAEDCIVERSAQHGVRITSEAALTWNKGRVSGASMSALRIDQAGTGRLTGAALVGRSPVVELCGTGPVTVADTTVHADEGAGVRIGAGDHAVLTGCSVTGGDPAIHVEPGSAPRLENCTSTSATGAGLTIEAGADPVVRRLTVTAAAGPAVLVNDDGRATLLDSVLGGDVAVRAGAGSDLTMVLCRTAPDGADVLAAAATATVTLVGSALRRETLTPVRPVVPGMNVLLRELDDLVGQSAAKHEITALITSLRDGLAAGTTRPAGPHLVLSGNPGTGRRAMAAAYTRILHRLGLLAGSGLTRITLTDLAQEPGTAPTDGCLLVDVRTGDESVTALAELIGRPGTETVVLLSGTEPAVTAVLARDTELRSRFANRIPLADPEPDELVAIVAARASRAGYRLPQTVRQALADHLTQMSATPDFAYAQTAVGVLNDMIRRHTSRMSGQDRPGLLLECDLPMPAAGEKGDHPFSR